jgi:hypothetical protein
MLKFQDIEEMKKYLLITGMRNTTLYVYVIAILVLVEYPSVIIRITNRTLIYLLLE